MNLHQQATTLLDGVYSDLERHACERTTTAALTRLFEGLRELRSAASTGEWPGLREQIQSHPVRALIHEDPMTRRSFEKPRGYAGDAVLLDYIYGEPVAGAERPSKRAVAALNMMKVSGATPPATSASRAIRCLGGKTCSG